MLATLLLLLQAPAGAYGDVRVSYPGEQHPDWRHPLGASPAYPEQLAQQGVVGCAEYQVQIDAQGRTQQIEFVSAVPPEVDQASREILQNWQWEPKTQNAQAETLHLRLDYCMAVGSVEMARKTCALQAELACR